ncbi:hypothetical protein KUTeg_004122 [Tegillarca granosa]|uniref:TRPM-like domain-containing protein n=1 Tax=Tegillarca granosa TaxID=220873 RepID=A0ABQ9FS82_TEGGR|nr:hypothetical protein KUTeg_004122 [Tegillarca granosa]
MENGLELTDFLDVKNLWNLYANCLQDESDSAATLIHNLVLYLKPDLLCLIGKVIVHLLGDESMNQYPYSGITKNLTSVERRKTMMFNFEFPQKELFIWALLLNRKDMAYLFWKLTPNCLGGALFASSLLKALAITIHFDCEGEPPAPLNNLNMWLKEGKPEQKTTGPPGSGFFEKLAMGVLSECFEKDRLMSQTLLVRRLELFGNTTLFMLANSNELMDFMGHICCQTKLNHMWKGRMALYTSSFRILICLVFPFLIPTLKFAMADTSHDKKEKNDNDETNTDSKHVLKSKVSPATSTKGDNPLIKTKLQKIAYMVYLGIFSYFLMTDLHPFYGPDSVSVIEYIIWGWTITLVLEEIRQIHASLLCCQKSWTKSDYDQKHALEPSVCSNNETEWRYGDAQQCPEFSPIVPLLTALYLLVRLLRKTITKQNVNISGACIHNSKHVFIVIHGNLLILKIMNEDEVNYFKRKLSVNSERELDSLSQIHNLDSSVNTIISPDMDRKPGHSSLGSRSRHDDGSPTRRREEYTSQWEVDVQHGEDGQENYTFTSESPVRKIKSKHLSLLKKEDQPPRPHLERQLTDTYIDSLARTPRYERHNTYDEMMRILFKKNIIPSGKAKKRKKRKHRHADDTPDPILLHSHPSESTVSSTSINRKKGKKHKQPIPPSRESTKTYILEGRSNPSYSQNDPDFQDDEDMREESVQSNGTYVLQRENSSTELVRDGSKKKVVSTIITTATTPVLRSPVRSQSVSNVIKRFISRSMSVILVYASVHTYLITTLKTWFKNQFVHKSKKNIT